MKRGSGLGTNNKLVLEYLETIRRNGRIRAMAMPYTPSSDIQDAEQIAALACLEIQHLEDRPGARSYLATRAGWAVMDERRRTGHMLGSIRARRLPEIAYLDDRLWESEDAPTLGDVLPSDTPDIDEQLDRHAAMERVRAAIEQLPDRPREVVTRRLGGERLRGIGASMGVTEARACQLEREARERISEILGIRPMGVEC